MPGLPGLPGFDTVGLANLVAILVANLVANLVAGLPARLCPVRLGIRAGSLTTKDVQSRVVLPRKDGQPGRVAWCGQGQGR